MNAAAGLAARDRVRWLAAGVIGAVAVAAVDLTLRLLVGWPATGVPVAIAVAVVLATALAASWTPRLARDGGRVLVGTLSVAAFTLLLCGVYLVVVRGLGNSPTGHGDRETLALSMVAAALAALSFGPARRQLVEKANRIVYGGSRRVPDELVRAFASRMSRSTPMEELLLQLAESLVRTMDLTRVDIYTGSGPVLERVAGIPGVGGRRSIQVTDKERPALIRAPVSGNAWIEIWLPGLVPPAGSAGPAQLRAAPIRNAGDLLGLLLVERSPSSPAFSEDDDRILGDLAREVGLALRNMQLDAALEHTMDELRAQAAELRESRARIVVTGDTERRRLERDLHDGAQQSLVALAISLRLARDLIDTDPAGAARMLDEMNSDVQTVVAELRELAHGIYPPLLAEGGLAPALSAAAIRSPLPVDVHVDTTDRFDQDTEAAVYFCCLEALQNSAKHAPDASVEVRIWRDDQTLFFRIKDNGPGFDPATTAQGQGLVNMTDRLGAIGGTVQWASQPGRGVEVSGSLPAVSDPGPR